MKLKMDRDKESVHLAEWPLASALGFQSEVLVKMGIVREVVTKGLELRQKAGIKIRQPLQSFSFEAKDLDEYFNLIKDELNVKEIIFGEIMLDIKITPELKQEGDYRELVRALQDMRKKLGFTPSDVISVVFETNDVGKKLIQKFENDMKKTVLVSLIEYSENDGKVVRIDDLSFKVKIDKI